MPHMARRLGWTCTAVLVALGVACFIVRGPRRTTGFDLALFYASVRGWCDGVNPYDGPALDPLWHEAGGPADLAPTRRGPRDLLYAPSTHVLLAPLATLPWPAAQRLWLGLSLLLVPPILAGIARLAGLRARAMSTWGFAGYALLLAPLHTAVALGQLAIALMGLLVAAALLQHRGRPIGSGLVLGVATALKPQVGALFVLYALARRRWSSVAAAAAVSAALLLAGALRLQATGIDWLPTLRANVAYFGTEGHGDPTASNPDRFQLLNLHYLYHTALSDRSLVDALVLCTVTAMAGAFAARWARRRDRQDELLALAMVGVLDLLVVYHRSYDAVLLLFVVAWGVRAASERRGPVAWVVLAALAAFLTPGGAALYRLAQALALDERTTASWWWQRLLQPHQTWALLVLGAALIVAAGGRRCRTGADSGT